MRSRRATSGPTGASFPTAPGSQSGSAGDPTDHLDSGPVGRALAQALQEEGVTVTGPTRPTTEHRDARDVIEGVVTSISGGWRDRRNQGGCREGPAAIPGAKVRIEGEDDQACGLVRYPSTRR